MKLITILMLIACLFSGSVLALYPFTEQACASAACGNSYLPTLGGSFYGNAMNVLNTQNVSSYAICYFDTGSLYTPMVGQVFTESGGASNYEPYVILTESTTVLSIYNKECNLMDKLKLDSALTARPILTDIDGNFQNEIAVVAGNVTFYQWNITSSSFQKLLTVANMTTYRSLECSRPLTEVGWMGNRRLLQYCTMLGNSNPPQKIYRILVSSLYPWEAAWVSTANTSGQIPLIYPMITSSSISRDSYQGISIVDDVYDYYYTPVCYPNNNVFCSVYDAYGIGRFNFSFGSISQFDDYLNGQYYLAKVGVNFRVITSTYGSYNNDPTTYGEVVNMMADMSGAKKLAVLKSSNMSNIAVADYNHDGFNDACGIMDDASGSSGPSRFFCTEAFGYMIGGINYSSNNLTIGLSSLQQNYVPIALGNYIYGDTHMQVFNYRGIFSDDGSGFSPIFLSNYTPANYLGYPVVVQSNTGAPLSIYADVGGGFIIYDSAVASSCGNGICDAYENSITCPADCNSNTFNNANCTSDVDCSQTPGYPKCVGQKCVAGYSAVQCIDSSTCPFNASLCYANYCIAGIYGGSAPAQNGTLMNDPTIPIGVQIDNMFNYLFQGSTILRFLCGLFLLLWATFEINKKYNPGLRSTAALVIIFSICLIAFTFLNLINKWVIYGIVLTAASVAIILMVLKFKAVEG